MANGVEVREATEIPARQLALFFDRMFPARASFLKSHWRWLYRVESSSDVRPLVALDGNGDVIGHAGVIPVTLRKDAQDLQGTWFVDFAVLPDYQRHGIGKLLTERWMAMVPVHVAFCNDRSASLFLKYGWRLRFDTMSLQLPLRPAAHANWASGWRRSVGEALGLAIRGVWRARGVTQRLPVTRPVSPSSLAPFAVTLSNVLHSARTDEFLTWRVAASPNASEHFILEDGASGCAALARICSEDSYRRLHLLAVQHSGRTRGVSHFLGGIVRWSLEHRLDHIWLVTGDPIVIRGARTWLPLARPARFAYHAGSEHALGLLAGAQHWEALDSDFDLVFA
jgi:GNAT superfamily N-acetyltransferase